MLLLLEAIATQYKYSHVIAASKTLPRLGRLGRYLKLDTRTYIYIFCLALFDFNSVPFSGRIELAQNYFAAFQSPPCAKIRYLTSLHLRNKNLVASSHRIPGSSGTRPLSAWMLTKRLTYTTKPR